MSPAIQVSGRLGLRSAPRLTSCFFDYFTLPLFHIYIKDLASEFFVLLANHTPAVSFSYIGAHFWAICIPFLPSQSANMPPPIPALIKQHRAYPRNGTEWAQAFRDADICDTVTGKCPLPCSNPYLTFYTAWGDDHSRNSIVLQAGELCVLKSTPCTIHSDFPQCRCGTRREQAR